MRTVEYGVFLPGSGTELHNMPGLAREIVGMTYRKGTQDPYLLPKNHANCPSQYQAPGTDEDPPLVAEVGSAATVGATNTGTGARRFAMVNGAVSRAALSTGTGRSRVRFLRQEAVQAARLDP